MSFYDILVMDGSVEVKKLRAGAKKLRKGGKESLIFASLVKKFKQIEET